MMKFLIIQFWFSVVVLAEVGKWFAARELLKLLGILK